MSTSISDPSSEHYACENETALEAAFEDFMLSREAKLCTPATLTFYRTTAGLFVKWLTEQGVRDPKDLTRHHVRAFLAEKVSANRKPSYIHTFARAIKTLVRFLHAEEYTPVLVKFDMPRNEKPRQRVLTADEVGQVIRACETIRDRALVLFLLDTGLRRQEFVSVNWGDVQFSTGTVSVKRGKGGKYRSVFIGPQTKRALMRYRRTVVAKEDAPLFMTVSGKRLKRRSVTSIVWRLSQRSGVHVTPHALRRTFATMSLRSGMNPLHLQRLLGHSTLEMVRVYAQMIDDDLREAHQQHGAVDYQQNHKETK